jgi:hypothetical protein
LVSPFLCNAKGDTLMAPPYARQTAEQINLLKSAKDPQTRAAAAEALGHLRNYDASDALAKALGDSAPIVRREAAVSLGFCGTRQQINSLMTVLDDPDGLRFRLTGRQQKCSSFSKAGITARTANR